MMLGMQAEKRDASLFSEKNCEGAGARAGTGTESRRAGEQEQEQESRRAGTESRDRSASIVKTMVDTYNVLSDSILCPICDTPLATFILFDRLAHIKRCAATNNIQLASLKHVLVAKSTTSSIGNRAESNESNIQRRVRKRSHKGDDEEVEVEVANSSNNNNITRLRLELIDIDRKIQELVKTRAEKETIYFALLKQQQQEQQEQQQQHQQEEEEEKEEEEAQQQTLRYPASKPLREPEQRFPKEMIAIPAPETARNFDNSGDGAEMGSTQSLLLCDEEEEEDGEEEVIVSPLQNHAKASEEEEPPAHQQQQQQQQQHQHRYQHQQQQQQQQPATELEVEEEEERQQQQLPPTPLTGYTTPVSASTSRRANGLN